jgi:hypothetical protein
VAWLALLLILVLAGVATTPFWAPFVTPLLPWQTSREQAMAARLAALDKDDAAARAEIAGLRSAQAALSRRLDESAAARADLETKIASLGRRLDTAAAQPAVRADLEAKIASLGRRLDAIATRPAAPADIAAQLAGLGHRLDTIAARPAADPAVMQKLQQDVAQLDKRASDFADRIAALEARASDKARSADRQAALLLALLQMREGVETAEPFAVPYDAFVTLAQGRPLLVAAAQPLAPLAKSGVASRAALARDLSRLADRIATARPAAPANDWRARVLEQLRGLVTVRRLDSQQTSPEAAVDRAETDLARGDLAAAVTALQALSGAPAAAARPWLAAARRRLAAETALSRLQRILAVRTSQQAAPAPEPAARPVRQGLAPPTGVRGGQ